jgi:hypothetical protein
VGDDGVLDTIVTWVKLTGDAAEEARRSNAPVEETRLHVGGLSNDTHPRSKADQSDDLEDRMVVAWSIARPFRVQRRLMSARGDRPAGRGAWMGQHPDHVDYLLSKAFRPRS